MSEANKDVALRFMEAMGTSDPELAATCLAADAYTVTKGFGRFTGVRPAEAMIGMIEAFKKMVPTGLSFTIHTVTAEGERVVVEAEGNAVTAQGKPYCNQYCFVFTLADGKIKQLNEYFCTVLADEVLWPLVSRAE